MEIPESVLDAVADILLDQDYATSRSLFDIFDNFVTALSIDSGLSLPEVQSRLVDRIVRDQSCVHIGANVIPFDDYRHLFNVN